MKGFLSRHLFAFLEARRDIGGSFTNALFICLLIGFSISVPGILAVLVGSMNQLTDSTVQDQTVTLFLKPDLSDLATKQLINNFESELGVDSVRYLSPDHALSEFQHILGLEDEGFTSSSDSTLLPPTIILTLKENATLLVTKLRQREGDLIEGIDEVIFDHAWIERLSAILSVTERLVWLLSTLLAGGVLLVISNALRFSLLARQLEFELLSIIGATNAYLARPFLYTGFWYGFGGALIAIILISIATIWLANPLHQLYISYGFAFAPELVVTNVILAVLIIGPTLGVFGAWVGVHWFLLE